jgi:formylglycine-generating enzyme required for sulfatase activity
MLLHPNRAAGFARILFGLISFLFLYCPAGFASGISVTGPFIAAQDSTSHTYDIQFDIAWQKSWFIGGAPASNANWDAAWVFAKYSVWNAGTSTWGAWAHCTLSKTAADHTAPTGSQITVGCSPSSACGGGDTGNGVFLYRSAAGTGTLSLAGARIRWLYGTDGVADSDRVKVKVFGIEMVYVPTASFDIGDGSASPSGNFQIAPATPGATQIAAGWSAAVNAPSVNSGNDDDAQLRAPGAGLLVSGTGGIKYADGSNLNASFPTGYSAFYMMKYDVSQRQYADFLNYLTRTQQAARVAANISADAPDTRYVLSGAASVLNRDGVAAPAAGNGATAPVVFGCDLNANGTLDEADDGGWNTAIDLTWMDTAAYAAWAGLRPFTELEFEKAARGPTAAVADEYAWGDAVVYNSNGAPADYALAAPGAANETVSNTGAGIGNAAWVETMCDKGSNNVCGPVRTGVFSASAATKSRQETGGSYYGVMGLSGNVWKRVVTVGNTTGRAFTGTHGSGALSAAGDAAQSGWPGYDGSAVTGADGSGFRGGSWISQANSLRVSDRDFASVATTLRSYVYGARSARTAP